MSDEECMSVDDVADFVNALTDRIAEHLVSYVDKEAAWNKASFIVANYVQAGRPLQKVDAEAVAQIAERAKQASEQSENTKKTTKEVDEWKPKKRSRTDGYFTALGKI